MTPGEKTGPLVSAPTHSYTTDITPAILLVADEVREVEKRGEGRQRKKELGRKNAIFNNHVETKRQRSDY